MIQPFNFQRFWQKYGNFILIGLFLLFIVNHCNQQNRYVPQDNNGEESVVEQPVDRGPYLKSYEELMHERQAEQPRRPNSFFTLLLLMALGVGIVWVTRQQWWKKLSKRWFPGRVKLKVVRLKDKFTQRKLLRISVENNTAEGLTFLAPMVVFSKLGKERRFRLKSSDQEGMFPLTLTPGTGHKVVIDLDQFYDKIPDLRGATRLGATIETSDGKQYKKFALPSWLDFLLK